MNPVTEMLLTPNTYSRPQKGNQPKGLVIHWTANEGRGANATANRNFFENRKNGTTGFGSAHYIVDNHTTVRCAPEWEMCYHVGSTTYTQYALDKFGSYPNNCTIGIEICVNSDGDFNETLWQTIQLAADICTRYGWDPLQDITTHKAIVGWKDCPSFYVTESGSQQYFGTTDYEGQWQRFLNAVHDVMYPPKHVEELFKLFNDMQGHWAEADVNSLAEKGVVHTGPDAPNFRPNDPVTRAEMAAIAARVIKYITGK